MKEPKKIVISVIIPTYNRATMLVDAVLSLCAQDLKSDRFEILVVDNNSQDNTEEVTHQLISEQKNHHIRYIRETRQGDFYARNTGVKNAHGDHILFTDDDALFDTNYLSTIIELFEQYPQVGVVGTRIVLKWEGGNRAYWMDPYQYLLGYDTHQPKGYEISSNGYYVNTGSLAIKKELYVRVGGINPAQVGDFIIGDAEAGLCYKLQQLGVVMAFTDDVTMWHRQIVGKNDSIKDIRRRMENFGITCAYTAVMKNHDTSKKSLLPIYLHLGWYALLLRRRKVLKYYFELCHARKYNEYIDRYQYDIDLLRVIEEHINFKWED